MAQSGKEAAPSEKEAAPSDRAKGQAHYEASESVRVGLYQSVRERISVFRTQVSLT